MTNPCENCSAKSHCAFYTDDTDNEECVYEELNKILFDKEDKQ